MRLVKDPDQAARMHMMIWIFAGRTCLKVRFLTLKLFIHYENTPIQIYRKFHVHKLKIFRYKTLIVPLFRLKRLILGPH